MTSGRESQSASLREMVLLTQLDDLDDDDVRYFSENPDRLDLITNRETLKLKSLWVALALAMVFVAGSKFIAETYADQMSQFLNNVVVDLVFEMGAALIGSVATVIFIEFQQKRQFEENLTLRSAIEKRIRQLEDARP
ncbi:MAG: hypothetical protein ACRBB0_05460 [Pelagimonas sp.]|jgi:hypothetical protein|uniref:hypothetical protein n=1 Tax=Pelagimonas sp. TaxID=2073170 RepID=UPI003CA0B5AA